MGRWSRCCSPARWHRAPLRRNQGANPEGRWARGGENGWPENPAAGPVARARGAKCGACGLRAAGGRVPRELAPDSEPRGGPGPSPEALPRCGQLPQGPRCCCGRSAGPASGRLQSQAPCAQAKGAPRREPRLGPAEKACSLGGGGELAQRRGGNAKVGQGLPLPAGPTERGRRVARGHSQPIDAAALR